MFPMNNCISNITRRSLGACCLLLLSLGSWPAGAQVVSADSVVRLGQQRAGKTIFRVNAPDYRRSPLTGMTRRHWKEAGLYLLAGAFSYVHDLNDPLQFPKQPGKSYPQRAEQVPVEKLEGLCRTLFIAGPLLKEQPNLVLNGIALGNYYRHQLGMLVDPQSETYIAPRGNGGPNQRLVEFGGLSLSFLAAPELFWDPLDSATQRKLAAVMLSYGDGPTIDMNWRYFNILILSFFKSKGYKVNEQLLEKLLQQTLAQYDGKGWYNDSPYYDYYSMWAFQMYGKLWSQFFGRQYYPQYAAQLEKNFDDLRDNYACCFSRKGEMIMWGRSISYRMGAAVPFPLMGLSDTAQVNFGWMRRIASGAMLQFLRNPDFRSDSIPTLGFYGAFEPAVQAYSCRGSAFWLGKLFLGLYVPAQSRFWSAVENKGAWAKELKGNRAFNKYLSKSNLLITDYPGIGASEIRAWCCSKNKGLYQGTENYNRLSYNSAFPWQADGAAGQVSMAYTREDSAHRWHPLNCYAFRQYENGIYRRDASFASPDTIDMNLAEITLPNGILRVDRLQMPAPYNLRLGHYSLPETGSAIKEHVRKVNGYTARIIDNGVYQLAMVPLLGWQQTETVYANGLNPVADRSAVLNAAANTKDSTAPVIYSTLLLWKKSGQPWTDRELMPVKQLQAAQETGQVTVVLADGSRKTVQF
jgi:hypothetical protein